MAENLPLGIEGRTAMVCGSSKGLGYACAVALGKAGVEVVLNGRSPQGLDPARMALSEMLGREVTSVVADVTHPDGRAALFEACPEPDILVTNAAGPPPGDFQDWDESVWAKAVEGNMITPIMLIRSAIGAMRRRRWGRVINITSAAVKAPLPMLGLSNGARSGLTGFVAGLAREVACDGVTVNNILPGNFATDRLRAYAGKLAKARNVDTDTILAEMGANNPTGRVGRPEEFGATCAFLASEHAGFITGQNLLLDGGAYPGTL